MQMSVHDYENITLGQFFNKLHGFYHYEGEKRKNEWMQVNYLIYHSMLLSPDIKQIDKPKTFDAFLEGSKPKRIETKAEFEKMIG